MECIHSNVGFVRVDNLILAFTVDAKLEKGRGTGKGRGGFFNELINELFIYSLFFFISQRFILVPPFNNLLNILN